ncbi:MAG: methylenetetrahydrofolate reductase C-terminal domain-containing protein [Siculibacillus sp.]|nr:methylenetetrahydrofolate reductase C-terminal domain-containing protein [Siculibacillus sp.]
MRALRRWSVRHAAGLKALYDACSRIAPAFARPMRLLGRARAEALLAPVERVAKGAFFDCRMCGTCVLSRTGLACPTNCGKGMRNGPCGGVRPDGGCEVDPTMRCVWIEAGEGRARVGAGSGATEILPPIDRRLEGRSTWVRVIDGEKEQVTPLDPARPRDHERVIHSFERACASGVFVTTVEIAPPDSADPSTLIARAERFRGVVDAINITDGAGGNCHMSSAAAAAVLAANGHVPVCQIAARDRNRIAVQGDMLGAAALGVRNVLCITGDDVGQGDHPDAKRVFDLDSIGLLTIARRMRDDGTFASGRRLEVAPDLFLGATANPFVPPHEDRIDNLAAKIAAGAQFIQTQFCFDVTRLERFMERVRDRGLDRRAAIIVGVGTLSSAKALTWMAHHVPGVHVPQGVITRIAAAKDQRAEGLEVLVETIDALRAVPGVAGVHLMGHRNEDVLAEAIRRSGLARPATATA